MLDFTLDGWDVVDALGLRRPHLVGHSMGGMIAAEMACVAPHDLGKLVLAGAAGLWIDAHPIPDIFTLLPYEFADLLFHDRSAGEALLTGGFDLSNADALMKFYIANQKRLRWRARSCSRFRTAAWPSGSTACARRRCCCGARATA